MTELFWWQAAAIFWASVCFFRVGAIGKGIAPTRRVWSEIAQAALIVVVLFALLTEGRGCTSVGTPSLDQATCVGDAAC